ncbi:MAG: AI-2E family transporter, partial [bacterium]
MYENKFFKISYGILLSLAILFMLNQIDYIFGPIIAAFSFLLIPLMVSIFLYYLLRPLVKLISCKIKYRTIAILLTFLLLIILIITISYFGGSIIQTQIKNLSNRFSNYYESVRSTINDAMNGNERIMTYIQNYQIEEKITKFAEGLLNNMRNNIFGFFSTVTNIGTMIVLIPFILYYFLKDDKKIYSNILNFFPENKKEKAGKMLKNVDTTLSKYIGGQLIIAIFLGIFTYICYLIIGLPNALILSTITMITSFIPFVGAIIGITPAILIGISIDLLMVVKIIIVLILTQQVEGNIIQPKIQGNRLSIHPLMVIIVVLSFVMLFGFLGALFAVPIYAVFRVIIG